MSGPVVVPVPSSLKFPVLLGSALLPPVVLTPPVIPTGFSPLMVSCRPVFLIPRFPISPGSIGTMIIWSRISVIALSLSAARLFFRILIQIGNGITVLVLSAAPLRILILPAAALPVLGLPAAFLSILAHSLLSSALTLTGSAPLVLL